MRSNLFYLAIFAALTTSAVSAADLTGTLKGTIVDRATQQPLPGANIVVLDAQAGGIAGEDGRFIIPGMPLGVHRLQVSMIGYQTAIRPDIVVRANRITAVEVELEEQPLGMEETVVTADYFSQVEEEAVSTVNFNYEEIRRSPGAAGDISRLLQALPAINMASDDRNDLIVRGGSPAENLVIIDNIEIPNINHFPTQGASGGPIGLLNIDLIADVNFSAGGFPATYGDRLSSVMEVDLREGNRDELDIQANLDMAGAGFIFEGPLSAGRGAWLVSARRSYLELIVDAIGTGAVPRYSDLQGKITRDHWEFSGRWSYAGGRPYTPFDPLLSAQMGTGIVQRDRINAERFPPYHRLDLRVDERRQYKRFNLVSYFTLLNAYNRKNIAAYYWDEDEQKPGRIDQWTFIPVGGFELEF